MTQTIRESAAATRADQNPDHQVDALLRAGVAQEIYVDRASGAKARRPQPDELLKLLRDGDTLKITRLDRLGRSVLHLVTLGATLRERGVGLHVIEQGIDTATAEGRAMFGMLSVLAVRRVRGEPQLAAAARCSGCCRSWRSSSASSSWPTRVTALPRPAREDATAAEAQRRPGRTRPAALRRRRTHGAADR